MIAIADAQLWSSDSIDESITELDSHANMAVMGKNAWILLESGKMVNVSPFTPQYQPIKAPIVDTAILYMDPFNGQEYILDVWNAIHVPEMENNLIPLFMLQETGVVVNKIPKIHTKDPGEDNRTITFPETRFRIPLSLWGTFSYFPLPKLTKEKLTNLENVYILTPLTWNPHSDAYTFNEEPMLDWEGNMKEKDLCETRGVLEDIEDNDAMASALKISDVEQFHVKQICRDHGILLAEAKDSTLYSEALPR